MIASGPDTDAPSLAASLLATLRPAIALTLVMTAITGIAYPLVMIGLAATLFPYQADGSLLRRDGRIVGSALIGQSFTDPRYFWGRPSATAPTPYNAAASSGSNFGPGNPALKDAVRQRIAALRATGGAAAVPVDLVTASGSGLDPDLSLAGVRYQTARVARARGRSVAEVAALIDRHTTQRQGGLLGEPRVNILSLNLALDAAYPKITPLGSNR